MAPRRSSSASASNAKRAKTVTTAEKCKEIVKAFKHADYEPSMVKMLHDMAPHCLSTYKEERHAHQNNAIDMIAGALQTVVKSIETKMGDSDANIKGRVQDHTKRASAADAASATVDASKAAVEGNTQALEAARTESAAATAALKIAKATQTKGDKEVNQEETKKARLMTLLNEELVPAHASSLDTKKATQLLKEISVYGVDGSLVVTAQSALTKIPAERSEFDTIAFDKLIESLTAKGKELDGIIASGASGKEERKTAVEAAQAHFDSTKHAQKTAADALSAATEEEHAAKTASKNAHASLSHFVRDLLQSAKDFDAAKAELDEFKAGPLSLFEELKVLEPPVEEPEEPEEIEADAEEVQLPTEQNAVGENHAAQEAAAV